MTDEEMRSMIHHAVDSRLSGVRPDPFLAGRVLRKGEKPMKKKIAVLPVLAALLLVLTAATAAAEALGINIFELFGREDGRYAELAEAAVLTQTPEPVTDGAEFSGRIANAYYDGETLMVAYELAGSMRAEAFTPDEAMLKSMEPREGFPAVALMPGAENELLEKWNSVRNTGEAMGIVIYEIGPSDHTLTDDGVDLPPTSETQTKVGADGHEYVIREYESPLPEEVRGRDCLNISIDLYRFTTYLYYDGKISYTSYGERETLAPMSATVFRADAAVNAFAGEGQVNGIFVAVSCDASAAVARIAFHADQPLPALPEDHWYECVLLDEAGRTLRPRTELWIGEDGSAEVLFDGTGTLPEELTLYILECQEGPWDRAAAMESAQPIRLTIRTE